MGLTAPPQGRGGAVEWEPCMWEKGVSPKGLEVGARGGQAILLSDCRMSRLPERDPWWDRRKASALCGGLAVDPELSEELLKGCRSGWVCHLEIIPGNIPKD